MKWLWVCWFFRSPITYTSIESIAGKPETPFWIVLTLKISESNNAFFSGEGFINILPTFSAISMYLFFKLSRLSKFSSKPNPISFEFTSFSE